MIIGRKINLPNLLEKKSHFLLGPRGTGKTFLIRQQLGDAIFLDLLSDDVYSRLLRRPSALSEMIPAQSTTVVIDEVQRIPALLCYWRSTTQYEVDLVVGTELAIEIKTTERVSDKHLKGLRALREEGLVRSFLVVSRDPVPRVMAGIEILPWQIFLERLWARDFV